MNSFDSKIKAVLRASGWTENRDEGEIEQAYIAIMGDAWIPRAAPFVRSFGNLTIGKRLWVYPENAAYDLKAKHKVRSAVRALACPVAVSSYLGDGSTLWVDSNGRFYLVDSEGMLFVGCGENEVFSVLFLNVSPPEPPSDIFSALKRAWNWNA